MSSARQPLECLACAAATAAALLGSAIAQAQGTAPVVPQSPLSFSGNAELFSQYIFRGLAQTNRKPALQAGFDYSHDRGFYAGIRGSNVSWVAEAAETAGVGNDGLFTHTDWKLELAGALDGGRTLGAAYTDTDAPDTDCTLLLGRHVGKATGYLYVKKAF